jgi:hypothetical protein
MAEETCKSAEGTDGVKICSVHEIPLQQQSVMELSTGSQPSDFTAWLCPASGKTILIPTF